MAYLLDAAVILIVVLCVWRGWRHGMIRTLVMLVGFALAAFLSGQLAAPLATHVYDGVIAPKVEATVVDYVQKADTPQVTIGLESVLGEDTVLTSYFEHMGWNTGASILLADTTAESLPQLLRPVLQDVIRPMLIHILDTILSFLLFMVLLIAVFLLSRLLDTVFKLPLLKQLNQFGGLAAGLLQGVFWTLILSTLVQLAAACGWLGTAVTVETLSHTRLMSVFAKWNWIF